MLEYKPVGFWKAENFSLVDSSGYNTTAYVDEGAETLGLPVAAGRANSIAVGSGTGASLFFDTNPIQSGKEGRPFSLVANIYSNGVVAFDEIPTAILAPQNYISPGVFLRSGLQISGTTVTFGTEYENTGYAVASFDVQIPQRMTVAGVHTNEKNSLFINDVLVAEVDITPEQQADTYKDSLNLPGSLNSGVPPQQPIFINDVAVFNYALSSQAVKDIHAKSTRSAQEDVPSTLGGQTILVSNQARDRYISMQFNDELSWETGIGTNVYADDESLVPVKVNGQTTAGTWIRSINLLDGHDDTPIDGLQIRWFGKNVLVEASIDHENWTQVTNGGPSTLITPGFQSGGQPLSIRITFDSGMDDAYIEHLRVDAFLTNTTVYDGRTLTFSPGSITQDEFEPKQLRSDWGTFTQSLTVDATDQAVQTVELWLQNSTTTLPTINIPGASVFVNGNSVTAFPAEYQNHWVLLHWTTTTPFVDDIIITGNFRIGRMALYPAALSTSNISQLISNYFGVQAVRVAETAIGVSEPVEPVSIYAYDWEIVAS